MRCTWSMMHTLQHHQDQKGRDRSASPHLDIRGGREDNPPEATRSRAALLPAQPGMKEETAKWAVDHGGKGGQVIRDPRGDGSGRVLHCRLRSRE